MSYHKVKTTPDLSKTSRAHTDAIALGKEHFYLSCRNVKDEFKSLPNDVIKAKLKETAFPYAVCFENWIGDFNIATGIRNANAFNAREVFYLGIKKIDRRGALGTYKYTDVTFLPTIDDLVKLRDRYKFIGIDNVPGSVSMSTYVWVPNSLLIFGEEGTGLTPTIKSLCDDIVHIDMFGSVRSLNCGTASGIIMNAFVNAMQK
jgi:tRNA G18 (ribose-2'-O)-methylase SpoU